MEKNKTDDKITFELNLKFQLRDYRFRLTSKKGWLVALIIIAIKLLVGFIREGP